MTIALRHRPFINLGYMENIGSLRWRRFVSPFGPCYVVAAAKFKMAKTGNLYGCQPSPTGARVRSVKVIRPDEPVELAKDGILPDGRASRLSS
jgi:hypothetical protein